METAYELAQRDYDIQIVKMAEQRICVIKRFMDMYEKSDLSKVYEKTNLYRKALINAAVLTDAEYIKRWLAVQYERKTHAEDAPEIITERGEWVRSKSEKIIADKLYSLGIPYRYECPVILSGNVKVYPDFTILKMPEKEEVYLEHLGMMDDLNYINNLLYKISTYETSKKPLNVKALDVFLRKMFVKESERR